MSEIKKNLGYRIIVEISSFVSAIYSHLSNIVGELDAFGSEYQDSRLQKPITEVYKLYYKSKRYKEDKNILIKEITKSFEGIHDRGLVLKDGLLPFLINNIISIDKSEFERCQQQFDECLSLFSYCKNEIKRIRKIKNEIGLHKKEIQFINNNTNMSVDILNTVLETLLEFKIRYNKNIMNREVLLKGNANKIVLDEYTVSEVLAKVNVDVGDILNYLSNVDLAIKMFISKTRFDDKESEQHIEDTYSLWEEIRDNHDKILVTKKRVKEYLLYLINDMDSCNASKVEEYQLIFDSILKSMFSYEDLLGSIRKTKHENNTTGINKERVLIDNEYIVNALNVMIDKFMDFKRTYNKDIADPKLHLKGILKEIPLDEDLRKDEYENISKHIAGTSFPSYNSRCREKSQFRLIRINGKLDISWYMNPYSNGINKK